jgi:hypothetical protein
MQSGVILGQLSGPEEQERHAACRAPAAISGRHRAPGGIPRQNRSAACRFPRIHVDLLVKNGEWEAAGNGGIPSAFDLSG